MVGHTCNPSPGVGGTDEEAGGGGKRMRKCRLFPNPFLFLGPLETFQNEIMVIFPKVRQKREREKLAPRSND